VKNPFLVSLGHEIRAPMNSLIGVTESLLESGLTPAQRCMAEAARGAAEALLEVINDMVVLSGIRDGRMKLERVNFDLVGMIGTVARLYAAEARQCGLDLTCRIDPGVPKSAMGDPGRLRQVLGALIGNAVKYTESGEVGIGVDLEPGDGSSVRLRFTVRDSGIGIPPEKLQSILNEPGQIHGKASDTRWDGEGYGLAVTQLILLVMGSHLEIESEVGKGSIFRFTVALDRAEDNGDEPLPDDWLHLQGARVLVVADSASQGRLLEEILGCAGVHVDTVSDAGSALEALTTPSARDRVHQMVIMDSYLPGTDCFELAGKIHALDRAAGIPLMVLSSGGQPGDGERCRTSGISAYLSKPVSRIELLQASAALLAAGDGFLPDRRLITRFSMEEGRRAMQVLMVDGSPANRQVTVTMLHRRGHRVDAFAGLDEALQAMEQTKYDIVLVHQSIEGGERLAAGDAPVVLTLAKPENAEPGSLSMPPEPMALFAAVERWGIPAPSVQSAEPVRERNPVDMDALTQMMRDAGIEDAVGTILQIFRNEGPAWMTALSEAAARNDAAAMAKAAHVFFSAAGSVKAVDLAALLQRIEDSGNKGDAAAAARLAEEAGREYEAVQAFLASD
jgi:CheY-like chemotaxis protein/HPt (histidine-containing phosphotransfer) domain-containing protein